MSTNNIPKPIILIIRDGWGINPDKNHPGDAVRLANKPVHEKLYKQFKHSIIKPAGEHVGLPKGYQGNSEVGHITLGAGRIVNQSLKRINKAIKNKTFFDNDALSQAMKKCKENNSRLHLMGLIQDQGVHAHQNHLYALLKMAKKYKIKKIIIHFFCDGRDSLPTSSINYLQYLEDKIKKYGLENNVKYGTLMGRYYAMDRNHNWERTKKAFDAIVLGKGLKSNSIEEGIKKSYDKDVTDEFIMPTVIKGYKGLKNNDSIIFFNYRYDRARQLTLAITENDKHYKITKMPNIFYVSMTEYYNNINCQIAFKEKRINNNLGQTLAKNGLRQLRIAETEKYAHVTFFFNSQVEKPLKNEDRIIIPSPKVKTYDLKPEMNAKKLTKKLNKEIDNEKYDVIICNFANADMVGHTAVKKAAVKAVETVDHCIGNILEHLKEKQGLALITSDHGNAEKIQDKQGNKITSHTKYDVDLIVANYNPNINIKKVKNGGLKDMAPTILYLLNIEKPKEMTGENLIEI